MGSNDMKPQKHTRKEIISILLVSNMGRKNKEIHVSRFVFSLFFYVPLLILLVLFVLIGLLFLKQKEQATLQAQIDPYKQTIAQLETEKESLHAENERLMAENAQLQQATVPEPPSEPDPEPSPYEGAPNGYPYLGQGGMLVSSYSEDQPYMSINTHTDGTIVAAGDGTIISITSSDTYSLIIELQHEGGYTTRYMCDESAQTQLTENAQVSTGDTLFTITVDNTQFDYQILFENEPIDPLMVIEAKG